MSSLPFQMWRLNEIPRKGNLQKKLFAQRWNFHALLKIYRLSHKSIRDDHKMAPLLVRRVKQFRQTRLISVIDIWIVEQFNKHLPYVKQLQFLHKNVSDVRDLMKMAFKYIKPYKGRLYNKTLIFLNFSKGSGEWPI